MQLLSFYAYSFIPFFGRKERQINIGRARRYKSVQTAVWRIDLRWNDRLSLYSIGGSLSCFERFFFRCYGFFSLLTAMLIEVLNSFKVFRWYTSDTVVKILLFCNITYVYFLLQQGKVTGRIWRASAPFNWNGTTVKLQAGRMWGITWRHLILALFGPPIHSFFHISPFLNNSRFALIECTSFLTRLTEGRGQRSSWNWTSHSYLSLNQRGLVPAPTFLFSLLYKSATYDFWAVH